MKATSRRAAIDPENAVGLVLSVEQITPFDKDPRQSPNSEYARIKDSILAQGIEQPLVVSRSPVGEHFVIAAGGNTRLRILHELYQETRDPRFAQVTCVIKPWRGDAETTLAHLRENDLRGALTFLDKARGICAVRDLLAIELAPVRLTQSELTRQLRARGFALSQSSISNMEYAVEILEQRIPLALRGGLSHLDVMRVRNLENFARGLWNDRIPRDSAEGFDEVFAALCQRYDGPTWDLLSLRQAVEAEIADRLNQTVHAVRLALDARMSGAQEVELPKRDEDDEWWPEFPPPRNRLQSAPGNDRDHSDPDEAIADAGVKAPRNHQENDTSRDEGDRPAENDPVPDERCPAPERGDQAPGPSVDRAPSGGLSATRAELAAVASALATRHGLGQLVISNAETGTGYLVVDVPEPALLEQFDEAGLAQVSMIWWQLMAFAEMTVAPIAHLLPHLSPGGVLYRALREQDAGLLFNAVWTLDPGQIGYRLWRTVGEEDWSDLRRMMTLYRALYREAELSQRPLWQALT